MLKSKFNLTIKRYFVHFDALSFVLFQNRFEREYSFLHQDKRHRGELIDIQANHDAVFLIWNYNSPSFFHSLMCITITSLKIYPQTYVFPSKSGVFYAWETIPRIIPNCNRREKIQLSNVTKFINNIPIRKSSHVGYIDISTIRYLYSRYSFTAFSFIPWVFSHYKSFSLHGLFFSWSYYYCICVIHTWIWNNR